MSLIFDNYKYNDKYNQNNPEKFIHYRLPINREKARRRILENFQNSINSKNLKFADMNKEIDNNFYVINSSPNYSSPSHDKNHM